ncbi:MAG: hypothetical protein ISR43_00085 [Acidimicrobiia bacterium]|nr:hypothetical protein [Actinomycetota bacterium]MBL6924017.1 hypothetical protein [Acidimicrobiia bacterium]MBL6925615.1 hypothetical protein [Acidimicrobiia bacterium]
MAGYDPQSGRTRPAVDGDSPVDDLLGHLPVEPAGAPAPVESELPLVAAESVASSVADMVDHSDAPADRPFDTPPVEMTDENADRLQRLAVLGAVIAFVVLLTAWRRRRS